jgi:hypothetical protein
MYVSVLIICSVFWSAVLLYRKWPKIACFMYTAAYFYLAESFMIDNWEVPDTSARSILEACSWICVGIGAGSLWRALVIPFWKRPEGASNEQPKVHQG